MSKVNVGKRTKAQDKEAADALSAEHESSGAKIVKDKSGATFAVTQTLGGLTVKTRIG